MSGSRLGIETSYDCFQECDSISTRSDNRCANGGSPNWDTVGTSSGTTGTVDCLVASRLSRSTCPTDGGR